MNTNTVEQAERLTELKVGWEEVAEVENWDGSIFKNPPMPKFAKQITKRVWASVRCQNNIYHKFSPIDTGDTKIFTGPALTLDDLHNILNKVGAFPFISNDNTGAEMWSVTCKKMDFFENFKRTINHAQDLTEILIWLLENGHVSAGQVNDILKAG